jgi:hypothetical protein
MEQIAAICLQAFANDVWARSRTEDTRKQLKIHSHAAFIPLFGLTLMCGGCSSLDQARSMRSETISFLTGTEDAKPRNPRVHPGRPYSQEIWLDP